MLELGSALYLYPLIVQGKPVNITTIPAFFPVIFELTVLFSAFGAVFGMLAMNLLPRWNHPLFNWDRFVEKATDDGFFVVVEASDPRFSEKGHARFPGRRSAARTSPPFTTSRNPNRKCQNAAEVDPCASAG